MPPDRIPISAVFLQDGGGMSLQERLLSTLVELILRLQAPIGARLPSTRALALHLGISRLTVTLVYAELVAQGYIESLPRSGHAIAPTAPYRRLTAARADAGGQGVDWSGWLNGAATGGRGLSKPEDWRSYPYPFLYGQPDPALFSGAAWRDCARRALGARDYPMMADDQFARDDPMLIDYILRNTLPRRGIAARREEVLLTVGAQNALYITARLLAGPRRLGVVEEPGYPDFAVALRAAGLAYRTAPVDEAGLNPAKLPQGASLVAVTPSHHIPTGVTMTRARRLALLEAADKRDFLIIEDDYETEMSFESEPQQALKSLDRAGRVIYIGSFSKSLFPGLRIGYLVGPAAFVAQARRMRAVMLRHPPGLLQRVTAYFLALGHYDGHVTRLRQALRNRRAALLEALSASAFRDAASHDHGGASLWVRAPGDVGAARLAAAARRRGVLIEPGAPFFEHTPPDCPFFRLGYSSIRRQDIARGIDLLAEALRDAQG